MGVHGLWRLIEPSGKPVPLESLENKILAVDVSIWLHHFVKGFQDSKGAPLPHAHLLGIYHRVCKLLYFRIKPVFVFDGGVPALKKQTIAKRTQQKVRTLNQADTLHKNLLSALVKHTALSKVLSEKTKAAITSQTSPPKLFQSKEDDLYKLPPSDSLDSMLSSDEDSFVETSHSSKHYDLHSINTESQEFKTLPVDVRHEILTDLKETRKQNSWGRLHELPTLSDDFSVYQMNRLLKRQSVQSALEEAEKEMGGHSLSLGELEQILKDQGVINNSKGNRIASDENTRYLLIKDLKQAIEDAKNSTTTLPAIEEENEDSESKETGAEASTSKEINENKSREKPPDENTSKADEEFQDDLQKAIMLSLEEPSTSTTKASSKGRKRLQMSFLEDFENTELLDSEESEEENVLIGLTPARRYMTEYSGLTPNEIAKIIARNNIELKKAKIVEIEDEKMKEAPEKKIRQEVFIVEDDSSASIESLQSIDDDSDSITYSPQPEEDKEALVNLASEQVDEKKTALVEVMSDSGSGSCDDFVEVDQDVDEESKAKAIPMEVVIKPDEEIEDDLFKDIFVKDENEVIKPIEIEAFAKKQESLPIPVLEEIVAEPVPIENKQETELHTLDLRNDDEVKEKTTSSNLKEKIENMIQNYSKSKTKHEPVKLSIDQMNEMKENLRKEQLKLEQEKSTKERMASNITDQIYLEAQELLELFGVPYLIAPMEAEAQCAFLDFIELTDGTITDDSDIWLFGGRTVYKNFFNQSKTVLEYKADSIRHHFKLTREQMILLAMLVGSDYTVGLPGVGPVTALEILAAFPPKNQLISGLREFKMWFTKGKVQGPGRNTLRSKLKNVSFSENFPNQQIAEAYLDPQVETSKENFTWAKPDLVGLVDFARKKFGWTQSKAEDVLKPVLKRLEDERKQKTIMDYYKFDIKVVGKEAKKKMSERVKKAVERIDKGGTEEEDEPKQKRSKKNSEAKQPRNQKKKSKDDQSSSGIFRARKKKNEDTSTETKPAKTTRVNKKRTTQPQTSQVGVDEEIEILRKTQAMSQKRVVEIRREVHKDIEEQQNDKKVNVGALHKKEVILQKQRDKTEMFRNKLKAIEVFRKSKQGPGYVKKRAKAVKQPKEDASYLSESDSN